MKDEDITAYIRELSQRKFRWKTGRNVDLVEDLFDDAMEFIHITGHESSKAEWIAEMRSGRFIYERITPKCEPTVKQVGNTAILDGRALFDVNMRGVRATFDIGYTEVYELKDGKWKLVSLKTHPY
ncbi:hypothetical protein WL88_25795 [Burkholderia diffusa]|uniref:DUF4440 domain-containing protein n=1 Tax=Burkholderia diffusa TaxID=488732 RepID=A0AAW3PB85_9BURK|nr:nuclear transport factor 2 family protein [Burkholderia diffusa]KWF32759.1 hypothetical protein WL86_29830 [Burkholderia diffusa]KWF38683.1 hypothetical protein WL85_10980 [Burkholderia diffusa]KWF46728.1 hypothetical protein WL88_25795 [Burkholderia diffusa]KWF50701.1 hypothetical protein WL87_16125 [Burkholderia diffusa]